MSLTPQSVDVQQVDTSSFQSTSSLPRTPSKQGKINSYLDIASPIFSSASSISSYTPRKRKFDERLKTRFSDILKDSKLNSLSSTSPLRRISTKLTGTQGSTLRYVDLDTLNSTLYSGHSRLIHGEPTCIVPGDIVAIGTSKGYIMIFDYRQNLIHELGKSTKALTAGSVVSISLSLDSTHIVAGFENGDVFLWNLSNVNKPVAYIPAKQDVSSSDGHLVGSSIIDASFIGKRHTVIVTSDIHGMVFYHHCHRTVLGFNISTKRILGKYENVSFQSNTIFASNALPLGSSVEYADDQGIMAILSPGALIVVSTSGVVRTQYKTGKPKIVNNALGQSGCQAWFPAYVLKNGDKVPARLAYCFSNVLTILEVKSVGDSLQFDSKKRWVCDELILGVQWINPSLIAMITPTQRLILLNEKTMKTVNEIDLLSKHLFKITHNSQFTHSYNSTFKTYKGKLFFVGKYEILIGSAPNWIDILLDLINKGKYIEAIETSRKYYTGTDDLEVIDLPLDAKERHPLVLKYLTNIIRSSASHVLVQSSKEQIEDYLYSSINTLISIEASHLIFEELYEVFKNNNRGSYFFESLEPFILNGEIKTLTPTILKDMVSYYISMNKSDTLEQNICLLDLQTLDIDFAISLLQKNNLRDSYIFIWNKILHDYVSPFLEFINDLRFETNQEDSFKVYGYLAYILTGRQYPTEDFIDIDESNNAKLTLYFILFNGLPVSYENGILETVEEFATNLDIEFPYLYLLIKNDSKSFLSAINECLEDSLLNDDEIVQYDRKLKVNRQFIVEILILVFQTNEFEELDYLNFAIFIARNYLKFRQFLRLGEDTLNDTITRLCKFENDEDLKEDCKLSLQSLLSAYQPPNKQKLIGVFENVKFYEILIQLYLNDRKYSKVLEIWVNSDFDKHNLVETTSDILTKCFINTKSTPKERNLLITVIENSFADIIEVDTFKIAQIINQFAPKLHKLALNLSDQHLKYMYLKSSVELEREGHYQLSINERNNYIIVLSKLDFNDELLLYVQTLNPNLDFKLEDCINDLRENGSIDTLIYLLQKNHKHMESLLEVLNYSTKLIDKLPLLLINKENLNQLEQEIWKYLQVAITLSNADTNDIKGSADKKLNKSEEMWLKLINFIVAYLKKFDKEQKDEKILDIVKRLVQDLFSSLINSRSQIQSFDSEELDTIKKNKGKHNHQSSFLKIFTEFLNSSSITVTLLGDVRSVTDEIYLSLSYEKNILTITSHLMNEGIYSNMEKLTNKNQLGWSVKSFECDACGKVIWGRGLNSNVYCQWEDIQRDKFKSKAEEEVKEAEKLDLVSFNCSHCYHRSCLEHLGNKNGYSCVICENENERQNNVE